MGSDDFFLLYTLQLLLDIRCAAFQLMLGLGRELMFVVEFLGLVACLYCYFFNRKAGLNGSTFRSDADLMVLVVLLHLASSVAGHLFDFGNGIFPR